jgi:hypothetical protein
MKALRAEFVPLTLSGVESGQLTLRGAFLHSIIVADYFTTNRCKLDPSRVVISIR